jgi:hypothetical protein
MNTALRWCSPAGGTSGTDRDRAQLLKSFIGAAGQILMAAPPWLELLSPLPHDVAPQKKPVASAEQLATGTAGPIAGWQNITLHLSEPRYGLRHVQVTLDEHGRLLSGSDHVMFVRDTGPDGEATLTDHESIGGRFELDGSFRGTCWKSRVEAAPDGNDDNAKHHAVSSAPTADQIAALRRIIQDVLGRVAS